MIATPRQPPTLVHCGFIYTLFQPWQRIDDLTHKGPFYAREDVDEKEWAFQPDSDFLWRTVAGTMPTNMHCVQQSPHPESPRPSP